MCLSEATEPGIIGNKLVNFKERGLIFNPRNSMKAMKKLDKNALLNLPDRDSDYIGKLGLDVVSEEDTLSVNHAKNYTNDGTSSSNHASGFAISSNCGSNMRNRARI